MLNHVCQSLLPERSESVLLRLRWRNIPRSPDGAEYSTEWHNYLKLRVFETADADFRVVISLRESIHCQITRRELC